MAVSGTKLHNKPAKSPVGAGRSRGKGKSRNGIAASRREEIVGVAGRLFAEKGFEATSVRQIASEVDILSGSLYHHFATKEEILHEILRKAIVPMAETTIRIAKSSVDAEQKLCALIIFRLQTMIDDPSTFGIIYNNRNFFRGKKEFRYVEQGKTDGFEAMESVLKEGIAKGCFKKSLDTYLTIGTIYRLLSGAADWFISGSFVQIADEPGEYSLDQVIDYHLDFIFSAIRSPTHISEPVPRALSEQLLEAK